MIRVVSILYASLVHPTCITWDIEELKIVYLESLDMGPKTNSELLDIIVEFLHIILQYWLADHQRGGGKGLDGLADV